MVTNLHGWMPNKRTFVIGTLLIALTGTPAIAEELSQHTPEEAALQAASWVLTVPYGAMKVVYALGGGVVGGLAWAVTLGNMEVAKAIWNPTMTGDYTVQTRHLTGETPLHFMGRDPTSHDP